MVSCGTLFRSRIIKSYSLDLILLAVLFAPYVWLFQLPAYERQFWRDDRSLMFPHKDSEIIPAWLLAVLSLGVPMAILTAWLGIKRLSNKRLLVAYLGLLLALTVTVQLTNIIKLLVGELRPDFLARCDVDPTILDRVVCRGVPQSIAEGRKSFPSGHTSSCFAGLGYAGFFLAGQLGLFDGTGYVYKFIVSGLPFCGAGFVGITRIMDYRHHWHDVLAGALLGIVIAYLSYRMYFPAIMQLNGTEEPLDERLRLLEEAEQKDTHDTAAAAESTTGLGSV